MNTSEETENEDEPTENKKKVTKNDALNTRIEYYRNIEKKIIVAEKKIDNIKNSIQDELKKLEMEWLHLKGMMNNSSNLTEEQSLDQNESQEDEIGLDDAVQINEMQCDFELNVKNEVKTNFSDDESDDSDDDSEDNLLEEDCDDNMFI